MNDTDHEKTVIKVRSRHRLWLAQIATKERRRPGTKPWVMSDDAFMYIAAKLLYWFESNLWLNSDPSVRRCYVVPCVKNFHFRRLR